MSSKMLTTLKKWNETHDLTIFVKSIFINSFKRILLSRGGVVVNYNTNEQKKVIDLIKQVKSEVKTYMEIEEAYQLYSLVKSTAKIKGDIAEVGVYKGGSAKLICEAKGNKKLHLFDTFAGLPKSSKMDGQDHFLEGDFVADVDDVKAYLKKYPKVSFYKGVFPSTAKHIRNKRFSFVNLDVDIYESTLNSLIFFYPRMNSGGVIMSHDYVNAVGVRKAVDGFIKDKPETVIELFGSQCLIVKH